MYTFTNKYNRKIRCGWKIQDRSKFSFYKYVRFIIFINQVIIYRK